MKKSLLFICASLLVTSAFAQQILFEPFDYTIGETLSGQTLTGIGTWENFTNGSPDDMLISAEPAWGDFGIPAATGNAIQYRGGGSDLKLAFPEELNAGNAPTVYYSFLINVIDYGGSTPEQYRQVHLLNGSDNVGAALYFRPGSVADTFNVGYSPANIDSETVYDTQDYPYGSQFFIVISYTFDGTVGKMWINPTVGGSEPAEDLTASVTERGRSEFIGISIQASSNARTPDTNVDEIRVGTTWESVTPSGATGSTDDVFASQLNIYPNPANDILNINSDLAIDKVEMFNLLGSNVIGDKALQNNIINISALSKGVYLLRVTSGDAVASRKIIKN